MSKAKTLKNVNIMSCLEAELCVKYDNTLLIQCLNCLISGNSIFCLRCGHGGHTTHILDWFKENDECPTGCSCKCVEAKSEITM